jgi:phosphoenolpyruvate carboxylase
MMISQQTDRPELVNRDPSGTDNGDEPVDTVVQRGLGTDIHLLGDLLDATIRRLAGEEAFALVEETRAAAKALRAEPSVEEARRIRDRLDTLDLPVLRTLLRAFSLYFDLLNLAEQHARVRANRLRTLQMAPQPLAESPEAALRQLRERGVSAQEIADLLEQAQICPVFTAHPSEARRRTILEKLVAISQQLDRLEYSKVLPREREAAVAAIAQEVETYWLTDTVRAHRPTVLHEVQHGRSSWKATGGLQLVLDHRGVTSVQEPEHAGDSGPERRTGPFESRVD